MKNLQSWGNYPKVSNKVFRFESDLELKNILNNNTGLIPYGNGKSYGDSALGRNLIYVRPRDYFLHFDEDNGLLHIQAGVLLSEILEAFVPRGWFLKITPGTKLITVAGAIASDVHGKNHHIEGAFSECVKDFRIMNAQGEILNCSREENPELFKATCGGQGLTGVILDARIYLKKISSSVIEQTTIKTANLKESFEAFEEYKTSPYSVAWIDCLAKGKDIGKSLLMLGDFARSGKLNYNNKSKLNVPFIFPSFALNSLTVRAFNKLYYGRIKNKISHNRVSIDSFFYPLDSIGNWNRIYGKNGFTQYQFILPMESSFEGLQEILKKISNSGRGSFLAVLKLYGRANENYLSFPMEGYSLALDFKIERGLFALLDELDKIVLAFGGRIYLAKDVRVQKDTFEKGYPQIDRFREFREKNKLKEKFQSLQSERLGL